MEVMMQGVVRVLACWVVLAAGAACHRTADVPAGNGGRQPAKGFEIYMESWDRIAFEAPSIVEGGSMKMHTKKEAEAVMARDRGEWSGSAGVMLGKNLSINGKGFEAEMDEIQNWLVAQGIRDVTFRLAMGKRTAPVVRVCRDGRTATWSAEGDWPTKGRSAVYPSAAAAGFDSPEGVSRLLEERWSLADIRVFCIPERRHNPMYQNLVLDTPEAWKGRLYPDQETGFDKISWYAKVCDGRVEAYSLGVYRGQDYWLLEIGSPERVGKPPVVAPDANHPSFIGHK